MNLDEKLQENLSPDIYCLVHNKIVNLEQQAKKQQEVIDELKGYLKLNIELIKEQPSNDELTDNFILSRVKSLLDILKEVSE